MTADLAVALRRHKVSNCQAMAVRPETARDLAHDISGLAVNHTTIQRSRRNHRHKIGTQLKNDFITSCPLVLHWAGKLMLDLTGS